MNAKLEYVKQGWEVNLKREYPICRLDDITVHMNHDISFEAALEKWKRRVSRIDYSNLLIVNCTESREMAELFLDFPYKNKICFTNFEQKDCIDVSEIYSYLSENERLFSLGSIVNDIGRGRYRLFDPFKLFSELS